MLYILNVGNTHSILADSFGKPLRQFPTASLEAESFTELAPDDSIFAACVVPKHKQSLLERFAGRIRFLDWRKLETPDFSAVTAETMGDDRVANAVMLSRGPLPALCVDFGTAIHAVAIDAEGVVVGGFILPGRQLMRNALAQGTAQLPSISDFAASDKVLSDNTLGAIAAGVDAGSRGAAARLIKSAVAELGSGTRLVFAGGDAKWFAPAFPNAELLGPTFTLQGLTAAAISGA